ncbi:MAG: STAS domain-containing protein [Chthoniobacterales bacterium]
MRLKERVENGVAVYALAGEIDFHFAPVLRTVLQGKVKEQCPALILDFSEVQFIDSRGIAVVLEYLRDSESYGGRVCLAALNAEVKPIIDTVRLETVMPIFLSVAEAAEAMNSQSPPTADPSG